MGLKLEFKDIIQESLVLYNLRIRDIINDNRGAVQWINRVLWKCKNNFSTSIWGHVKMVTGFPRGSVVKTSPANEGDLGSSSLGREGPWRRKWQPTPVVLPGESHGRRRLAGCSPWYHKEVGHNLATKPPPQQRMHMESEPLFCGNTTGQVWLPGWALRDLATFMISECLLLESSHPLRSSSCGTEWGQPHGERF